MEQRDETGKGLSRGTILVMAGACGAAVANLYYNQPILGEIARSFGAAPESIGLVPTLIQVGYALGLLLLAPLGDRMERRRLILGMLVVLVLSLAGAALAPTVTALALIGLLIGSMSSIAQQIVPLAATLAPPAQRGRVVGTVMSGLLIGILLARTVSGFIGSHAGWREMFWVAAGLMVVNALVLARYLPRSRPQTDLGYGGLLASLGTLVATQPVLRQAS